MNELVKQTYALKIEALKKRLEAKNFKVSVCDNADEVKELLASIIKEGSVLAAGGSATISELGLLEFMRDSKYNFIDRYQPDLTKEEVNERLRQGLLADYFFTSTNAISMDGNLYNIDGTGNRVAAMVFGPKHVFVFCSLNKIFDDEESAISHVRNVASVANCLRLKKDTPCAKVGYCVNCNSENRICSSFVKIERSHQKGRIHIIFINDEYGF